MGSVVLSAVVTTVLWEEYMIKFFFSIKNSKMILGANNPFPKYFEMIENSHVNGHLCDSSTQTKSHQ